MSQPRVFVTRQIPEGGLRLLRAASAVTVWEGSLPPSREELVEQARDCAGLQNSP